MCHIRLICWAWCLKNVTMMGQAKTLSILCRVFHQTAWKRWIIYSSRRLFELRMMKIFKVSKTDIAGKTLLQWLVEYDADVHIQILLDAGYSIFRILTRNKYHCLHLVIYWISNICHNATRHIYDIRWIYETAFLNHHRVDAAATGQQQMLPPLELAINTNRKKSLAAFQLHREVIFRWISKFMLDLYHTQTNS